MSGATYEKEITALVLIDPYNDFISEGGKVWDSIKTVAEANKCVPNIPNYAIATVTTNEIVKVLSDSTRFT